MPFLGPCDATIDTKGLTASGTDGCTTRCTSEAGNANAGTVEALAAALLGLSPADRARLAAMLLGQDSKGRTGETAP
jgi:hypothetical protein